MSITRVEYVDHDQFKTIDDEISQAFALYVLCRFYLAYGGKITSLSNTELVADVTFLRPEKMILSGDEKSMASLYRAANAIRLDSKLVQPSSKTSLDDLANLDGMSFALTALAQAHSGEKTAWIALLAGVENIVADEAAELTTLSLDDALAAYRLYAADFKSAQNKTPLTLVIAAVRKLSNLLKVSQLPTNKDLRTVNEVIVFACDHELDPWTVVIECIGDQ